MLFQQRKHGNELAEDQHAMAAVDDFFEQFAKEVDFAGCVGGIDVFEFEIGANRNKFGAGARAR
jgi:hypothetical protein